MNEEAGPLLDHLPPPPPSPRPILTDGAHLGILPSQMLGYRLWGDALPPPAERLDRAGMAAWIESAPRPPFPPDPDDPGVVGRFDLWIRYHAWALVMLYGGDPKTLSLVPFTADTDDAPLLVALKRRYPDITIDLGVSAWGWAVNAVRFVLQLDPYPHRGMIYIQAGA